MISLMHSKSVASIKTNSNFFNKNSNLLNFQNLNGDDKIIKSHKNTKDFRSINSNFNTSDKNILPKIKILRNKSRFYSFNTKSHINEANKIMQDRLEDKKKDLMGKQNKDKFSILSDTRQICRNNYIIDAIKKNMSNIKIKIKNYHNSLIKSDQELKTDFKNFTNFLDEKNNKIKEENITLLKLRELHDQINEKYDKELLKYKKLSEDLEKKVKIICLLKNYGAFIHKLLGIQFWLDGIPDINQKTKNIEGIADLLIEKYRLLNEQEKEDNEEYFDDQFLIIRFKELEQRVIQEIESNKIHIRDIKEKLYKKDTIDKMNLRIKKLDKKNKEVILSKNILVKNIDKTKSIKHDDESVEQVLSFIKELGKETEKGNIDANIYFPNLIANKFEKKVKDDDFRFYTVKTLNNLKIKETLINKFGEYINSIKNSEDRNIIMEIEQENRNKGKKEKLKILKEEQAQKQNEKNKKALERNTRFVVIGRKIPTTYQFSKNKKIKNSITNKAIDDMQLLYDEEDD